ncbi:hypothetical protein [Nocardioides lianchengensis]|uniref:Uncharacterized protein n=1 Tax=Nocardioides lianchengensis TaxID=1045774 RepID=A0A1G6TMG3_9ACTN|nr:hypothetical protein [Nocardioides lianchengensis]NYG11726.1 hypothetical protein [Nocardioides lianchengensis]SDD29515.1 hypothetical protein SAMN05421872_107108 [Nocardioides lianchengensis]
MPAEQSLRAVILELDPVERSALIDLLREELARGWVPKRADLEAALESIRSGDRSTETWCA